MLRYTAIVHYTMHLIKHSMPQYSFGQSAKIEPSQFLKSSVQYITGCGPATSKTLELCYSEVYISEKAKVRTISSQGFYDESLLSHQHTV